MLSIKQNVLSSQYLSYSASLSRNTEVSVNRADSIEQSVQNVEQKSERVEDFSFSEKNYEGKIRNVASAEHGVQEGISKVQCADSAMGETEKILREMRELARKAFSGDTEQRTKLQSELKTLRSKLDDISANTEYNSEKLLQNKGISIAASSASMSNMVQAIAIDSNFAFNKLAAHLQSGEVFRIPIDVVPSDKINLNNADITTDEGAKEAASLIDNAIETVDNQRSKFDNILSGLSVSVSQMQNMSYNFSAVGGSINSVDSAFKTMSDTKSQVSANVGALFSAHSGGSISEAVYSLLK